MVVKVLKFGMVGFIGGMDILLIYKFECGFVQGFKVINFDGKVLINYIGMMFVVWNDLVKGGELLKVQIGQGVDVVYVVVGGMGIGVLQVVVDVNILLIGVDSNQNYLYLGKVLILMVKGVDNLVYEVFKVGVDLQLGIKVMDFVLGGVLVVMDDSNKLLMILDIIVVVDVVI